MEWPGLSPRGCAYVTFENEGRVRAFLAASRREGYEWYYRITSRKARSKEVRFLSIVMPSIGHTIRTGILTVRYCWTAETSGLSCCFKYFFKDIIFTNSTLATLYLVTIVNYF